MDDLTLTTSYYTGAPVKHVKLTVTQDTSCVPVLSRSFFLQIHHAVCAKSLSVPCVHCVL